MLPREARGTVVEEFLPRVALNQQIHVGEEKCSGNSLR